MAQIMDVTLRDGGYEVNFDFTQDDVVKVGKALEGAGIKYMEIGHGQGLNASCEKFGIAACSDSEYLKAAQDNLPSIRYGTFCIPGIARLSDLDVLAKYGASFVRVGCNTTEKDVLQTRDFIRKAKDLGLLVFANYMKTYAASPEEFAECTRLSESFGADVLVIVDSAGCMLPEDISGYYDIIKTTCRPGIAVGFHGHDNLGLAVYNTLHAMEIGCEFVDTSLQSLGRGAGNASTEQLIAILHKKGTGAQYSLESLMLFSENYLRHRVKFKGVSGLDTFCGIAGFHSGYMNSVRRVSEEFSVNPYSLIVEYCKEDKIGMDEERLKAIAVQIASKNG